MAGKLPGGLAELLEAATSEAKRYGHVEVTPAHLAVVIAKEHEELAESEFTDKSRQALMRVLARSKRGFDQPVPTAETLALLEASADRPVPLKALASDVRVSLLKADAADTVTKTAAKDQADAAAAAAAHAAEVAGSDKTAAITKQNADLDALVTLLNSNYRVPA